MLQRYLAAVFKPNTCVVRQQAVREYRVPGAHYFSGAGRRYGQLARLRGHVKGRNSIMDGAHKEKHSRLAFIGMSGSGKTFWSRKLVAAGWGAVSCDDLIEQRLAPRLAAGGFAGINGVATWMGWPDSVTYAQREAEYLAEEVGVMDEFLNDLQRET